MGKSILFLILISVLMLFYNGIDSYSRKDMQVAENENDSIFEFEELSNIQIGNDTEITVSYSV